MSAKREYGFRVEPYHCDMSQCLTLVGLGDTLLSAASSDAKIIGAGPEVFGDHCGWIILRMAMDVRQMPRLLESFTVRTWVTDVNRLSSMRCFEVVDSSGEVVATASTIWAAINLDTRRPLNLLDYPVYTALASAVASPCTTPLKLASPEERQSIKQRVQYSHIDSNGHTYSMNYLRMALDMLPLEMLQQERGVRVDINYIHETHYGEELTLVTDGGQSPLFEIRSEQGTAACRIKVEW